MVCIFLGHIILFKGIEVDPIKMDVVKICPKPISPSNIRRFLDFTRYYRRFVLGFSLIASLFETLTNKVKFTCSEACDTLKLTSQIKSKAVVSSK